MEADIATLVVQSIDIISTRFKGHLRHIRLVHIRLPLHNLLRLHLHPPPGLLPFHLLTLLTFIFFSVPLLFIFLIVIGVGALHTQIDHISMLFKLFVAMVVAMVAVMVAVMVGFVVAARAVMAVAPSLAQVE